MHDCSPAFSNNCYQPLHSIGSKKRKIAFTGKKAWKLLQDYNEQLRAARAWEAGARLMTLPYPRAYSRVNHRRRRDLLPAGLSVNGHAFRRDAFSKISGIQDTLQNQIFRSFGT